MRSGCFIGSCPRGYIVTWLTREREREREGERRERRGKEEGRESEAYPSKGPEFTVLLSQSSAGQRARESPLWRRAEVVHSKLLECVRLSEISSSSPLRLLGDTHRPRKGGHNAELYLYCDFELVCNDKYYTALNGFVHLLIARTCRAVCVAPILSMPSRLCSANIIWEISHMTVTRGSHDHPTLLLTSTSFGGRVKVGRTYTHSAGKSPRACVLSHLPTDHPVFITSSPSSLSRIIRSPF